MYTKVVAMTSSGLMLYQKLAIIFCLLLCLTIMELSPMKLSVPVKRQKLTPQPDFSKCLICQETSEEPLRKASGKGLASFFAAFSIRKCTGTILKQCIIDCLQNEVDFNKPSFSHDVH